MNFKKKHHYHKHVITGLYLTITILKLYSELILSCSS